MSEVAEVYSMSRVYSRCEFEQSSRCELSSQCDPSRFDFGVMLFRHYKKTWCQNNPGYNASVRLLGLCSIRATRLGGLNSTQFPSIASHLVRYHTIHPTPAQTTPFRPDSRARTAFTPSRMHDTHWQSSLCPSGTI